MMAFLRSTSSLSILVFAIASMLSAGLSSTFRRSIVAVILLLLGSFAIRSLVASPRRERRIVLGFGTSLRNIAAATVVAVEDIKLDDTLVLIVVASIVDLIVLLPLARWLRAHPARMEARYATHQETARIRPAQA